MAEKRMLAKAVSQSRKVNSLSIHAALLWTWAIPWFDAYGYMEAEPDTIKLNIIPRRKDIPEKIIPGLLRELSGSGLWKFYKTKKDGRLVVFDPKFKDFQNIRSEREGKQKFTPGELLEWSWTTPAEDRIEEVSRGEVKKAKEDTAEKPTEKPQAVDKSRESAKDALLNSQKEAEPLTDQEKRELASLIEKIKAHYNGDFRPLLWLQGNMRLNWKTHLHVMRQIVGHWPAAPKAYADKIASVEEGNFNERDHIQKTQAYKADFMGLLENLKKLQAEKTGFPERG